MAFSLIAALLLAAAALPGTALAAPAGITGPYSIARADCNVGNGWRDVYAPVPRIFASNRTAGSGNDKQAVYYWVRAYDHATGTVLTPWTYGGGAWANDNAAGVLPAAGTFGGHPYITKWHLTGKVVRLQYFIRWNTTTGSTLGTTDPGLTSYQLWIAGTNATSGLSYAC